MEREIENRRAWRLLKDRSYCYREGGVARKTLYRDGENGLGTEVFGIGKNTYSLPLRCAEQEEPYVCLLALRNSLSGSRTLPSDVNKQLESPTY